MSKVVCVLYDDPVDGIRNPTPATRYRSQLILAAKRCRRPKY